MGAYLLVSLLSRSESRLVDTTAKHQTSTRLTVSYMHRTQNEKKSSTQLVNGVVNPIIELVNLRPQGFRVQVKVLLLSLGKKTVEAGVEESDDLGGFV